MEKLRIEILNTIHLKIFEKFKIRAALKRYEISLSPPFLYSKQPSVKGTYKIMMHDAEHTKNYSQMMEIAQGISPDAKLRKLDMDDRWEIYIPTDFTVDHNLPEEYEGTPAWEAFQKYDSKYGNELSMWGDHRDFEEYPIEAVADYYNVSHKQSVRHQELLEEFQNESGIRPENHATLQLGQSSLWLTKNKELRSKAHDEFLDEWTAVEEKWS